MKQIASRILMASAFALPPKTIEKSWNAGNRKQLFASASESHVWQSSVLDPSPLLSGLLKKDSAKAEVSWVESSGDAMVVLSLATQAKQQKKIQNPDRDLLGFMTQRSGKIKSRRGSWEFLNNTLFFVPHSGEGYPLWNLTIQDDLVSMNVDNDRSSWMGLSVFPNKLYHLFWLTGSRRDEAILEILSWDNPSELVSWIPCSEGNSLLIENTKDGESQSPLFKVHELSQNNKTRTLEWLGSANISGAWATAAVSRSCKEIYVTTTVGLMHLKK